MFITENECTSTGGTYQGNGVDCTMELCIVPSACCLPDGFCSEEEPSTCESLGGVPQGDFVVCADVTCPQPGA
ncbi:MAG: hypothetical protein KC983_09805, partial [Phycisphaerales bacterium]|nr:hypothetical protein [Phycisphaerales bacterium]